MDLPPSLILGSISDFCVLFFKDKNHDKDAPPHFHIVFPVSDDAGLIVTIITSQIDKRRKYYSDKEAALHSLVGINNDVFEFLKQKSIIDCNHAELLTKSELINRIDRSHEWHIKSRKIPLFLKREVCAAIKGSPLISPYVKKLVKEVLKSL